MIKPNRLIDKECTPGRLDELDSRCRRTSRRTSACSRFSSIATYMSGPSIVVNIQERFPSDTSRSLVSAASNVDDTNLRRLVRSNLPLDPPFAVFPADRASVTSTRRNSFLIFMGFRSQKSADFEKPEFFLFSDCGQYVLEVKTSQPLFGTDK